MVVGSSEMSGEWVGGGAVAGCRGRVRSMNTCAVSLEDLAAFGWPVRLVWHK